MGIFFDNEMVGVVCAATAGTLLIHCLLNVPEALLQRRFNFKRRLIVDPTTAGTFAIVTVVMVSLGFGVWGMVIGLYASQLATLIACWWLAKWRPGKGRFVFRIWREMAGFAAPLIASRVVEDMRDVVQSSLIGRRLGEAAAGQYRYGRRIGVLPGTAIIQVASYVLFPAFARIAADASRFHDGFLRSLRALWTAVVPLAAFLVVLGPPAIVVLLGEQWAPAGLLVAGMAGFGPGTAMGAIGVESIKGAGQSKRMNWLTATTLVVGIGGLIALLPFGLLGVGLAVSLEGLATGLLSLALARKLAGVSVGELARVLVPPAVAAAVAAVPVALLEYTVAHSETRPDRDRPPLPGRRGPAAAARVRRRHGGARPEGRPRVAHRPDAADQPRRRRGGRHGGCGGRRRRVPARRADRVDPGVPARRAHRARAHLVVSPPRDGRSCGPPRARSRGATPGTSRTSAADAHLPARRVRETRPAGAGQRSRSLPARRPHPGPPPVVPRPDRRFEAPPENCPTCRSKAIFEGRQGPQRERGRAPGERRRGPARRWVTNPSHRVEGRHSAGVRRR